MNRFVLSAFLAIVAGAAFASPPQFALPIIRDLQRAGVSDVCINSLSSHTFAILKGIQDNRTLASGTKQQRIAFRARQACGESPSLIDMAVR